MKIFMTVSLLFAVSISLTAENIIPLSVSWNVVESRWERTSDERLLFIMGLNYPWKLLGESLAIPVFLRQLLSREDFYGISPLIQ